MHPVDPRSPEAPRVVELQVADEPAAWEAAGFDLSSEGTVVLGEVAIRPTGRDGAPRGVLGWTMSGVVLDGDDLDGLPTAVVPPATSLRPNPPTHPNGAVGLDHVVVATPDLARTIAAIEAAGCPLKRIRETEGRGRPMRQAFFRFGATIVEVVSGDLGTGLPAEDAPATFFGLALDVADLDVTATHLGDGLGRVKVAVQRGRRIATLRHEVFDLSVPVALMDHHGDR